MVEKDDEFFVVVAIFDVDRSLIVGASLTLSSANPRGRPTTRRKTAGATEATMRGKTTNERY